MGAVALPFSLLLDGNKCELVTTTKQFPAALLSHCSEVHHSEYPHSMANVLHTLTRLVKADVQHNVIHCTSLQNTFHCLRPLDIG